jgi:hypothetical protein
MSSMTGALDFSAGCCLQCGRTASHKCARCQVARYCSVECQRSNWPSHKGTCKELLQRALVQVEDLVFDVSADVPRALIRPRLPGEEARGKPVALTPAQLSAPLGQLPYGQQGGGTPPQPVVGSFRFGTSVELPGLSGGYDDYARDAPVLGGGRLVFNSAKAVSDSMFSCNVIVEEWKKAGAALWRVEDVIAVVLERFRVKQPPSTEGLVWGSRGLGDFWAVSVKSGTPGQFCLSPHLYYHYTLDVTGSNNNCAIM